VKEAGYSDAEDCLDQAVRREQVARRVGLDVGPAPGQAGHRCEMDDRGGAVEKRLELGRPEVDLVEGETRAADEPGDVALLDRARVVIDERVDADDLVATGQQCLGKVRSNKPGDAGDDNAHQRTLPAHDDVVE
jgi:hypothetical protein